MCLTVILKRTKKPSTKNVYYYIGRHICGELRGFIFRIYILLNTWQDARQRNPGYTCDSYFRKKYMPYFHIFTSKKDCLKYLNIDRAYTIGDPHELILMSCKIKGITKVGLQNGIFCVIARYKKTLGYEKITKKEYKDEKSNQTKKRFVLTEKENQNNA